MAYYDVEVKYILNVGVTVEATYPTEARILASKMIEEDLGLEYTDSLLSVGELREIYSNAVPVEEIIK